MRLHRLLAVLAITAGLCAPRDAAAICDIRGPYLGTGPQLPLGCPLHVYGMSRPDIPYLPVITVMRNGNYVEATGEVTRDEVLLQNTRTFVDCQFQHTNTMQSSAPYQHFAIVPKDVQVGELIGYDRGWFGGIEIVAAGPCAAPLLPHPTCTETPFCGGGFPPFDDVGPGGCAAESGGGGLAIGALLLGLCAPRRRRR